MRDRSGLEAAAVAQVESAVRLVREVLGADAIGAYLRGSAVLGGLRPSSDLDVFVVARRRTTAKERQALVNGLLQISGHRARPARPLELAVVAQSDVRPWCYPPRSELLYGEWLRDEFERGDIPSPGANPDLAVLITMVRQGNRPLFGPPPSDVLDPVPPEDLSRAIIAGVPDLLSDLGSDTRNVVLTFARIWMTLATGTIGPKGAAAGWALTHLPAEHRPVLARARAIYLGTEPEHWEDLRPQVRPHVDHVVGEIERLAAARPYE